MRPGSRHQLTGIRVLDAQDAGNLPVRIVEGFPEDVRSALSGRELLDQHEHGDAQGFVPLSTKAGIGARVDRLRQPRSGPGLPPRSGGLQHVDGEPGRRGDQERRRVPHGTVVRGLPSHPDVLNDVLGFSRSAEHAIGDAEQTRPDTHECREAGIGSVASAAGVLRRDPRRCRRPVLGRHAQYSRHSTSPRIAQSGERIRVWQHRGHRRGGKGVEGSPRHEITQLRRM